MPEALSPLAVTAPKRLQTVSKVPQRATSPTVRTGATGSWGTSDLRDVNSCYLEENRILWSKSLGNTGLNEDKPGLLHDGFLRV